MSTTSINRRSFLRGSAFVVGAAASMPLLSACGGSSAADGQKVSMQGGWLLSEGQLGEAVALANGWYEEEDIAFDFKPGGPSIDGVALVGSKQSQVGQVSSSPSLLLAASQSVPVKAFAVGVQQQPYAFISKPGNAVIEPKDLIGKTVGTQATGQILLDALLKVNDIDPGDVTVEIIGAEITPLTTDQVDVWTGWLTNVAAMRPLNGEFEAMMLWDAGVQLYGYPYYAHADTLKNDSELLEKFVSITARGWKAAFDDLDTAAAAVAKMDKNLKAEDVKAAGEVLLPYAFNEVTAENGWGAMDEAVWQQQIDLYDGLDQFANGAPALDDVVDMSILEATASDRPKIG
jgi:NitT/TauT family transport system substrate-binding protein